MLKELDVIILTHDFEDYKLKKGTQGAIVHCYYDQQAYEVEFVSDEGETLALLTLESGDIQLERDIIKGQVLELLDCLPSDLLAEVRDFAEFLGQKQRKVS